VSRTYYIKDVKAIRVLASPFRQLLIDSIVSRGPMTVAQLATLVNRQPDRLYYHVRLLLRVGLLLERQADGDRGESEYDVPGRPMVLDYGTKSGTQRKAVGRVVAALMRTAQRDFRNAAAEGAVRVDGPRRELWSGRAEGALSPADLEKVNQHLLAAIAIIQKPRAASAAKSYQLTWSLTPTLADGE
jgi:hypothetical protein